MTFDEHKKECAMCGQSLPENQISDMVAKFNTERSTALEKNIEAGKKMGADIKKLQSTISEKEKSLAEVTSKIETTLSQYNLLNKELETQRQSAGTFEESETFKNIKC
jgi:SMC interacting uncharacterized protein involved in chromosome segregation